MSGKTGVIASFVLMGLISQGCGQRYQRPLESVICIRVIDGDTCEVEKAGKRWVVRLVGIDAWETRYSQRLIRQVLAWKRQGYGVSYALACEWGTNGFDELARLLPAGGEVMVQTYGVDRYNRVLGSLYVSNLWINEKMVESGWAMVYLVGNEMSKEERQRLLRAQERAKQKKRGMWKVLAD